MYRIKRARSVIHSLAHHGVSALSWLHPRLGEECYSSGLSEVTFDLINVKISTVNFKASKETLCAFDNLRETFEKILKAEIMDLSVIQAANITFGFKNDNWPYFCVCELTGSDSKLIQVKLDWCGNKFSLLSECKPYS